MLHWFSAASVPGMNTPCPCKTKMLWGFSSVSRLLRYASAWNSQSLPKLELTPTTVVLTVLVASSVRFCRSFPVSKLAYAESLPI